MRQKMDIADVDRILADPDRSVKEARRRCIESVLACF